MRSSIWLGLAVLAIAAVLTLPFLRDQGPPASFPEPWRAWLAEHRRYGHYSAQGYLWCDGRGYWVTYEPDGDWSPSGRPCWLYMLPTPAPRQVP